MNKPLKGRRLARWHAFHIIFQYPFMNMNAEGLAEAKAGYYDGLDCVRPAGVDAYYIDKVTVGVLDKIHDIDGVIEQFLRGWELERLNKVDLALLRLAIYEIINLDDVPTKVAVNEAVEIAKEFGDDDSPKFINGLLGSIAKYLEKELSS